jgi:preprotein translocase subunit YajC
MKPLPLVVGLQAGGSGDPIGFLVPMAAIMLIFYFLLIRPQQKRQKEHDQMLKAIEKGDRVVTSGGLHGVVTGAAEDVLTLDIGQGERLRVKVDRARVERRIAKTKGDDA